MNVYDGGYSRNQYDVNLLRARAKELAEYLPKIMRRVDADAVVVTGKSGLSLAFATLMLIDFPLIVVRKRGENSHGNPVEGKDYTEFSRYIVLDDFVSSGTTITNIMDSIGEYAEARNKNAPELVGIVEYTAEQSTGMLSGYIDPKAYTKRRSSWESGLTFCDEHSPGAIPRFGTKDPGRAYA